MTGMPSADALLCRNEEMVGAPIEGGYVLLDVEAGKYLHLNSTATRVWEMLDAPMTFAALCTAMQERFEVDPDRCARELGALTERMLAAGLLRRDP